MNTTKKNFLYATLLLVALYFLFVGLSATKNLFAPLATAGVLSLLVMPLCNKLENHGFKRWATALLSAIGLFLISLGFVFLVGMQIGSFAQHWPKVKKRIMPQIEQVKDFVSENTPLTKKQLAISPQAPASSSKSGVVEQKIGPILGGIVSFSGNFLLTFVYIFFLLHYRSMFRNFLIAFFPDRKRETVKDAINKSARVVPQYLVGKAILMGINAVLYAVGLGLAGVQNYIMLSLVTTILTLIPYLGNIIGYIIAIVFGYISSSDPMIFVWITLTFSVAQFVETYIINPFIIGDKVDLHPFFVIVVIIVGDMMWGIIGMVLAVPLASILTIILLHIKETKEIGLLLSKDGFTEDE
ncbi:MAG: AI-2E family transporter [Gillisia sp.]